jgi:hypothetical protein
MKCYQLNIDNITAIDESNKNTKWYNLLVTNEKTCLSASLSYINIKPNYYSYSIILQVKPITMNIKEDTMLKILSYLPSGQKMDSSQHGSYMHISKFSINEISMLMSYCPILLSGLESTLAISELPIKLTPIIIENVKTLSQIKLFIYNKWSDDISPEHLATVISNTSIVKRYSEYIKIIKEIFTEYFNDSIYSKILRTLFLLTTQGIELINVLSTANTANMLFYMKKQHNTIRK